MRERRKLEIARPKKQLGRQPSLISMIMVDQAAINGESVPCVRNLGDPTFHACKPTRMSNLYILYTSNLTWIWWGFIY